jgi:2'-5' RNA ligase
MAGRISQPPFTLHLDDAGQWLRSRVVWLGTRQPRGLLQLANMLRAQAARSGCYQSPQPFHPHITLLRDAGQAVALPAPGFHWAFRSMHSRFMNLSLLKDAHAIRRYSAGRWATR